MLNEGCEAKRRRRAILRGSKKAAVRRGRAETEDGVTSVALLAHICWMDCNANLWNDWTCVRARGGMLESIIKTGLKASAADIQDAAECPRPELTSSVQKMYNRTYKVH